MQLTDRRDNKGRLLRVGETQEPDGRYRYNYQMDGKRNNMYSWKLEPTDPLPEGVKPCLSLREKIAIVEKEKLITGAYRAKDYTVLDLLDRYLAQKNGLKISTKKRYANARGIIEQSDFSKRCIADVRTSEIKGWLIDLQNRGVSYGALCSIRSMLKPAFQMAVDDDVLMKNPFNFTFHDVVINDSKKRVALTPEQEAAFLEHVKTSKRGKKYYDGIFVLFKTGMRISEFCGLLKSDIDMEARTINLERQLMCYDGKRFFQETKTSNGARVLPMTDEVYECFQRLMKRCGPKTARPVERKKGFFYFTRKDNPFTRENWEVIFKDLRNEYNQTHEVPLPTITPHVCRHTYCTNMAMSGMNPKALQYLMGHGDINTTMDIYTHAGVDNARKELKKHYEYER